MTGQEMFKFKNWAVVGDVLNERKFAYRIVGKLESKGYNVFKVNPRSNSDEVYKGLREIGKQVDVIDLVISPRVGIDIVREVHEIGIDKIFIQPGAESQEILDFCQEKGINVYEGCVLVEL